jgi:hypothetical protein
MLCGQHIEMHHSKRGVWLYHCKYRVGDIDPTNGQEISEKTIKT